MDNRTPAEIAYDATRLSPAPAMPADASPLLVDLASWADAHMIVDRIEQQQARQQAETRAQIDATTDPAERRKLILRLADQVLRAYAESTEEEQIADLLAETEARCTAPLNG